MPIFFKYIFGLIFFLTISFFSATGLATKPFLENKAFSKTSSLVTVVSFKAWVENLKKKLKLSSVKKSKTLINRWLKQVNQQLQAMKVGNAPKVLLKKNTPNKQSGFLLPFQLASFKELFPLLFLVMKEKNKKPICIYLKQKIVYDIYPNYEDTKNLKLPYAHKELREILQIICT